MTDVRANPEEAALLKREGLDTVAGAFAHAGSEELSKPDLGVRRRIRLRLTDHAGRDVTWYLKRYDPEPWRVRLAKRLTRRRPDSPARREALNIGMLAAAGLPTMRALAMGEELDALGPRRSYLVVSAVPGEALERCFDGFLDRSAGDEAAMEAFNAALVELACKLHSAGLVHRDFYTSHIFLDETPGGPRLYVIDLARVFAPRRRWFRWRVKDLAQLKYSMPARWVRPHWEPFLAAYLARMGVSAAAGRWAAAIERKVVSMRRRQRRRRSRAARANEQDASNRAGD